MSSDQGKPAQACPVCELENQQVLAERDYGDKVTYQCSRCGKFTISGTAEAVAGSLTNRMLLSAWIRERNLLKVQIPVLTSDFLEDVAKSLPDYSPLEKQSRLLHAIKLQTDYPGKEVLVVPEHDVPLAWAENEKELAFYIQALVERGLLQIGSGEHRSISDPVYPTVITAAGWEYLDTYKSDVAKSHQVFVAMSFDDGLKTIYDNAIAPAIKACGYRPYRVDSEPHLERIDAKIVAEIKASRFMVADVTQQKAGVYYEAGLAHGLGMPVIWCVRKDDLGNVHFDTRQYNHIVWDSQDGLAEQLKSYIRATVGEL